MKSTQEYVIVLVVMIAVLALVVWFFLFAGHPLLSGAPPV
jgi:hypothetical protein